MVIESLRLVVQQVSDELARLEKEREAEQDRANRAEQDSDDFQHHGDKMERELKRERQRVAAAQQARAAAEGELARERQERAADGAAAEQARQQLLLRAEAAERAQQEMQLRVDAAEQEMQLRTAAAQAAFDELKEQKIVWDRKLAEVQQQLNEPQRPQQLAAPLVQRSAAAAPAADVASLTQQLGAANLERGPSPPQQQLAQAEQQQQQQAADSHMCSANNATPAGTEFIDLATDEDEDGMEIEGEQVQSGAAPATAPVPAPSADAQLEQLPPDLQQATPAEAAASQSLKRLAELAAEAAGANSSKMNRGTGSFNTGDAAHYLVGPLACVTVPAQVPCSAASCLHVCPYTLQLCLELHIVACTGA
jgi:hypothetical protein